MLPQDILQAHKLRLTKSRMEVLAHFLDASKALTHADLETALPGYDRVTLYRTLNTFLDEGILHKVLDDSASLKFALSHTPHSHAHFKCERCAATTCLHTAVPIVKLPGGYTAHQQELLVLGICASCAG